MLSRKSAARREYSRLEGQSKRGVPALCSPESRWRRPRHLIGSQMISLGPSVKQTGIGVNNCYWMDYGLCDGLACMILFLRSDLPIGFSGENRASIGFRPLDRYPHSVAQPFINQDTIRFDRNKP